MPVVIIVEREEAEVDEEEFKAKLSSVQMHVSASQGVQGYLMISEGTEHS